MRDLYQATELIKRFEGIEDGNPATVNLDPYLCPAGYWTIGWGHVVLDAYGRQLKGLGNRKAAMAIYPEGITRTEALVLLVDDVRRFAAGIDGLIKVDLTDGQYAALVSLAYNIGINAFANSELLRTVNNRAFERVPEQFMRWTKSGGRELAGLKRRRQAEVDLWRR